MTLQAHLALFQIEPRACVNLAATSDIVNEYLHCEYLHCPGLCACVILRLR